MRAPFAIPVLLAAAQAAAAQTPSAPDENFYKGRTLTIVVGYSAGGGYDQYARTLARHIGGHIPGNPTVLVQNIALDQFKSGSQ